MQRTGLRQWPLPWVGMSASLLFHLKALAACQLWIVLGAWLWWGTDVPKVRLMPVEQGRASPLLMATMEATPDEAAEQETAEPVQMVGMASAVHEVNAAPWVPQRSVALPDPTHHDTPLPELPLVELTDDPLAPPARKSPAAAELEQEEVQVALAEVPRAEAELPSTIELAAAQGETSSSASNPSPESAAASGSDRDAMPRIVYNPAPPYPAEALRQRLTGRVVLRVRVGREGHVVDASVYRSSGVPALDEAALATVWKWRFDPARGDDGATEAEVAVPIQFTLAGK